MKRVAVVLPGRSYGPELPALAIPVSVARECGYDVVAVQYLDDPWPDWHRAEAGDWSEVLDLIAPQISPAIADADAVVVIAKSMGTSIVNGVGRLFPKSARAIWITRLFGDPDVRRGALELGWECLSVFGTRDSAHDPAGQAEVTRACAGLDSHSVEPTIDWRSTATTPPPKLATTSFGSAFARSSRPTDRRRRRACRQTVRAGSGAARVGERVPLSR